MSDLSIKDSGVFAGSGPFAGFASFASLVVILGTRTKTNDKLEALIDYFSNAGDKDKVWVIALFSGRRPKRAVNSTQLRVWCTELTGLPAWLFEESYHTVGDLAETIALLLPEARTTDLPQTIELGQTGDLPQATDQEMFDQGMLRHSPMSISEKANDRSLFEKKTTLSHYLEELSALGKQDDVVRKKFIVDHWMHMGQDERFVFNKLITGGFRIGVSQKTIVNALAKVSGLSSSVIAHRISGNWDPATISYDELLSEEAADADSSRPYPFYLAYALEEEPASLGDPRQWQAEWKWDGIRGQIVKREDQLFVWSRGEELMTEKFPEYQVFINLLPDGTVLDGEIIGVGGAGDVPLPFAALQTRIGRKNVTRKQLEEVPAGFIAYDLLEFGGMDQRELPLEERRTVLETIISNASHPLLQISPVIPFEDWPALIVARERSRDMGSEGIMLKKKDSPYQVGRKRGDWWKWKIDPLVIDAVMIYAQKGHGRRSNLYTDYTFAVKDGDKLVSFAKAYSGLTDKELGEVDHFVKNNSIEKFGPVRTVRPELVFEIAFEGIAASARHKSGVALRFPRINRWRKDKKPDEIDTLENLQKMLKLYGKS